MVRTVTVGSLKEQGTRNSEGGEKGLHLRGCEKDGIVVVCLSCTGESVAWWQLLLIPLQSLHGLMLRCGPDIILN